MGAACPDCGQGVRPGDRFCENCGRNLVLRRTPEGGPLSPARTSCRACGAAVADDGFCEECGRARPAPRDRMEFDLGAVAGVSDRGRVRARNEDALAAAVLLPGTVVAIVCDGVGSAERAGEAAQLAADTALDRIVDCLMAGKGARESVVDGHAAAFEAVRGLAQPVSVDLAPSCTFVAAVVAEGITVGWVGDSRAYWLTGKRSRQLTVDDTASLHTLSRWVGADAEPGPPNVTTLAAGEPGVLLLCSDGLWNHVPRPAATSPAALVAAALELGGDDNVTAVAVPHPSPGSEAS